MDKRAWRIPEAAPRNVWEILQRLCNKWKLLENKYGSENVTIENDQPDEKCKFYQYINVKKGNSDLTFSFLDIDGFDWKFDTERYHNGKRYDLSVYFKDSFPEVEEILESAELIKEVKKIVNDILKWEQ